MRLDRIAALGAAVLLTAGLALTACSSSSSDDTGVVRTNLGEPQNPLLPANQNDNNGSRIVDRLFAGLKYYDANGKAYNEVAQSIETNDRIHYKITLKPDWKFTDGTPVTAKSFVDAWNYAALGTNAQIQGYVFSSIVGYDDVSVKDPKVQTMSGLQVVDDHTFTVALKSPSIDFEAELAYAPFYPLPAVAFKDLKAFGENPIGNGPYKFARNGAWQHNVQVDLVPNPDYKGSRPAKNKGLRMVMYQSLDTAYADLQAGNLDTLDTIPDSALATYKKDLGDRAITKPTAQNSHVGVQPTMAHFGGQEGVLRRKAISMAVDRKLIADKIFHDLRVPARDFTARTLPGFNSDLPGADVLNYNPDEAKKVWAQADAISPWSGQFQIAYNSDGGHQAWVDAVCNSIKNTLGIDAAGAPYPTFKDMRSAITNKTIGKGFRYGWQGDYPTMLEFLTSNYYSTAGYNNTNYDNPEFDHLIDQALAAPTQAESDKLVGQAQTLLLRDLPSIPLFDYIAAGGRSDKVKKAELNWAGQFDFENIEK